MQDNPIQYNIIGTEANGLNEGERVCPKPKALL